MTCSSVLFICTYQPISRLSLFLCICLLLIDDLPFDGSDRTVGPTVCPSARGQMGAKAEDARCVRDVGARS